MKGITPLAVGLRRGCGGLRRRGGTRGSPPAKGQNDLWHQPGIRPCGAACFRCGVTGTAMNRCRTARVSCPSSPSASSRPGLGTMVALEKSYCEVAEIAVYTRPRPQGPWGNCTKRPPPPEARKTVVTTERNSIRTIGCMDPLQAAHDEWPPAR